jgi:uncharacterized protein (UPF0332 family)
LHSEGRLVRHKTCRKEVSNLLQLVRRDIKDAKVRGLSVDRKFATAYNAVLQLAMIILYCAGYRTKGAGSHFTVFQAMKEILGKDYVELADYFDACRSKRNITDYDYAGVVSKKETEELIKEAEQFQKFILKYLRDNFPQFFPK